MNSFKKILPRKRSRTSKQIVGFLAIFALSGAFLQTNVGMSEVHADEPVQGQNVNATPQIDKMGLSELLDLVLKVVYILLWPLLVISGRSLDNTLIYGSIFHLDVPLWKFWNMMKNFANFTMGFLVLFAIVKSFFTKEGVGTLKDSKGPLGLIKKTLIAGILIQASWFLLAATIDVSTIATYAVGGLPLNVIKNTTLGQKKILATNTTIDFDKFKNITAAGDIFNVTYSIGTLKLSACQLSNNSHDGDPYKYIIGRKTLDGTEVGKCVLRGSKVMVFKEDEFKQAFLQKFTDAGDSDYLLYTQGGRGSVDQTIIDDRVSKGYIVDIYASGSFMPSQEAGKSRTGRAGAITLSELVSRSKGFVGPLVTIYSSLLNFAEISDTGVDSYGKMTGEMVIRAGFAIMLFFPLLALAVVLIIRVGFLRLVIAASPFIVLARVFSDTIKLPKGMDDHFKLENIGAVIFAPVITVFALSMALIFISTLISTFEPSATGTSAGLNTTMEPQITRLPTDQPNEQKYSILGAEMTLSNFNRGGTLDRFSWLLVNLVAVGLMRALLFAAINANSLGKKFAQPIQKFGEGFMQTVPIIPMPGFGNVGVGAIGGMATDIIGDGGGNKGAIIQRREAKENKAISALMDEKFGDHQNDKVAPEKVNTAVEQIIAGTQAATAFEQQGITGAENIQTAINNNATGVVQAIQNIKEKTEQEKVITEIGTAINQPDWYKKIVQEQATKKFDDAVLVKLTETTSKEDAEKLLTSDAASSKTFFDSIDKTPKTYEKTVGKSKFTITATTKDSDYTYQVEKTAVSPEADKK